MSDGSRNRERREVIRYLIVGVLTTIVGLGIYYALVFTVLDPKDPIQLQAANVLNWIGAVTFAYFMNRRFVFESRDPDMLREAASFYAARVGTLLLEMGLMFLLVTAAGFNDKISKLFVQVLVIIGNYVLSKWFVFREKRDE